MKGGVRKKQECRQIDYKPVIHIYIYMYRLFLFHNFELGALGRIRCLACMYKVSNRLISFP